MFSRKHGKTTFDDTVPYVSEPSVDFTPHISDDEESQDVLGELSLTQPYLEPTLSYSGDSAEKTLPPTDFDAEPEFIIAVCTNDTTGQAADNSSPLIEYNQNDESSFNFMEFLEQNVEISKKSTQEPTDNSSSSIEYKQNDESSFNFMEFLEQNVEVSQKSSQEKPSSLYIKLNNIFSNPLPVSPLVWNGSTVSDDSFTPSSIGESTPCQGESTPYQGQSLFKVLEPISPIAMSASTINRKPVLINFDQDVFESSTELDSIAAVSVVGLSVFSQTSFSGEASDTLADQSHKDHSSLDLNK